MFHQENKIINIFTEEEAFNLIKKERKFLGNIQEYKIKISNSNNFERENLIGVYKIRQYTAEKEGNHELSKELNTLITNLDNYLENKLKFISVLGKGYYGMFYLSQNYDRVVGYLEREIDEDEFNKLI